MALMERHTATNVLSERQVVQIRELFQWLKMELVSVGSNLVLSVRFRTRPDKHQTTNSGKLASKNNKEQQILNSNQ